MTTTIPIRETPEGASFLVRVQPRAKRNAIQGVLGEALRIALSTPPVDGRANAALIAFLAEILDIPRSRITIAAGEHARNKRICVADCRAEQILARLQAHLAP